MNKYDKKVASTSTTKSACTCGDPRCVAMQRIEDRIMDLLSTNDLTSAEAITAATWCLGKTLASVATTAVELVSITQKTQGQLEKLGAEEILTNYSQEILDKVDTILNDLNLRRPHTTH